MYERKELKMSNGGKKKHSIHVGKFGRPEEEKERAASLVRTMESQREREQCRT